jgi:hypothetical protein
VSEDVAQVYRLLSDGIPLRLDTRIVLRITGDPREEVLPARLGAGRSSDAMLWRISSCVHRLPANFSIR